MNLKNIDRQALAATICSMLEKTEKTLRLFKDSRNFYDCQKYRMKPEEMKEVMDKSSTVLHEIVLENEIMRAILAAKPRLAKKHRSIQEEVYGLIEGLQKQKKAPWLRLRMTQKKVNVNKN